MTFLSNRKDLIMSKQEKQTPQELKQSVLDRLDAARNAVEELSEEDLESIVGGALAWESMGHTMGSSDDPHMGLVRPRTPTVRERVGPVKARSAYATTMAIPEGG